MKGKTSADILDALTCGQPGCACVRSAQRGVGLTHCPAHDDHTPSLSVSTGQNEQTLVYCHAGCDQTVVVEALRERRLWAVNASVGRTKPVTTLYQIKDVSGKTVAEHVRTDLPDGSKQMSWKRNGKWTLGDLPLAALPLYGTERLNSATEVIVTEGEKAADALLDIGIPAVGTVTGASGTPGDDALTPLIDLDTITL